MDILDRARKMVRGLGPEEPPRPQFYGVACPLGHVLRGPRAEGYQALRCPACGAGVFVLPRSPLPEPPTPAIKRLKVQPRQEFADDAPIPLSDPPMAKDEADAEIEWGEAEEPSAEPEPAPTPAAPAFDVDALIAAASPTPKSPPARPAPSTEQIHAPSVVLPPPASPAERLRRNRHPLIFVGILILVAATIGGRAWRERRQNLPRVAEMARIEGLEALAAGDFGVAKSKLAQAAAAFEELRDEKAQGVRQLAGQAAILADLVGTSLEEMLDEAAYKPEEWAKRFDTFYKGRSVVVDALVARAAEGEKPAALDYRIIGDGRLPKLGEIDLSGLKLFEAAPPRTGDTVSFGARLAAIRIGDRGVWRFHLDPDSGVAMVRQEILDRIPGWVEPEDRQ